MTVQPVKPAATTKMTTADTPSARARQLLCDCEHFEGPPDDAANDDEERGLWEAKHPHWPARWRWIPAEVPGH